MSEVTQILDAIQQGHAQAADQLLPLVYEELRKLAAHKMASEPPGQTLQPTALVHEAWLRLVGNEAGHQWNSRGHFFGAAAEAMRRILIERARAKARLRRGGGQRPLDLESVTVAAETAPDEVLLVNEALEKLEAEDPEKARLVKLRFFAGLTNEEAAALLGISVTTVKRHWTYARAWLYDETTSTLESPNRR
ncbi:MAG: sigma-70 family RNA polymerase sigma factor [Verrucomicrobia bacterium]|nr:sigma-70 family RNA polymerase sigma factor [Verrucomicrobiota bacterium]